MKPELKILMVEDSPADQILLSNRLNRIEPHRLRLKIAPLLQQADELLLSEPFDLIFLDKMLPDCSGDEDILQFIRKHSSHKIVVLTADDRAESVFECVKAGALDFLVKSNKINDAELKRILLYAGDHATNA